MIDRFPALDNKSHYRRPPQVIETYRVMPAPKMDFATKVIIALLSAALIIAGMIGLGFVGLLIVATIAALFGA